MSGKRAKKKSSRKPSKKERKKAPVPIPLPSAAKKFINQQMAKVKAYAQEVNGETDVYLAGVRALLRVPPAWTQDPSTGDFRPATKEELKAKKKEADRAAKIREMLLNKPQPEAEPKAEKPKGDGEKK